ncbi:hypothetical protein F5X99DRAFT_385548 [Biscogniauxia marginata]|nr:hypothetical protein F5X99DRAFT_385548 [Biscogniauxia marginata]
MQGFNEAPRGGSRSNPTFFFHGRSRFFTVDSDDIMAELALAILPLCLTAIKGIGVAKKKLKILRHHDSEMKRLRKKFTAQIDIFLDECQLLFQEFLDPKEAESIIENTTHPRWNESQLDEQLREYLGRKYGAFSEAVAEIKDYITTLSEELDTKIAGNNAQVNLKASEKMREAVGVMVNKSKYDSLINGLKDSNQDIKRLRKTASKIQRCQVRACAKRPRPLPSFYHQVMQHSKSFYDALRNFWSCFQVQHTSHDVRLLLDSRTDGTLRVIVRYCTNSGFQVQDGILDLLVRSQSLRFVRITLPAIETTSWASLDEGRPNKARRVRFSDDRANSSSTTTLVDELKTTTELYSQALPLDLCPTGDICSQLCRQAGAKCCSYLDTSDNLRHHLSSVCNPDCDHKECLNTKALREPAPLDKIFNLPVERSISVPEQVRLALKLVKGVLQFHSTPWLQPYWRLQDLSYFQTDDGLAASLNTLHISTELSQRQQQQQCDTVMTDNASEIIDAQLACGIRNLTMHSLGVALLQIGQWNALKPDDIVEVRKVADLAERDSRLGPRYQKITQQCLDCDFGFGKDLSQPELQSAVYKDVVCELESLINTLEGRIPEPS